MFKVYFRTNTNKFYNYDNTTTRNISTIDHTNVVISSRMRPENKDCFTLGLLPCNFSIINKLKLLV